MTDDIFDPLTHSGPSRCKARDLDDVESYHCTLVIGHDGPHQNPHTEPSDVEPWEVGGDGKPTNTTEDERWSS